MSTPFDAGQGLVVMPARMWGPFGDAVVHLALDTGATYTLVRAAILVSIGYDPATALERLQVTTASGVEFVPRLRIQRLEALSQSRAHFDLLCLTLPPTTSVDGVLGLDFVRGQRLVIDFRKGLIDLR